MFERKAQEAIARTLDYRGDDEANDRRANHLFCQMPFTEWLLAEIWGNFFCSLSRCKDMAKKFKISKRSGKKGKGSKFRPCHVCGQTVNFVQWMEESIARNRNIWHWANEDGSHHIHMLEEVKHLRDILAEK